MLEGGKKNALDKPEVDGADALEIINEEPEMFKVDENDSFIKDDDEICQMNDLARQITKTAKRTSMIGGDLVDFMK